MMCVILINDSHAKNGKKICFQKWKKCTKWDSNPRMRTYNGLNVAPWTTRTSVHNIYGILSLFHHKLILFLSFLLLTTILNHILSIIFIKRVKPANFLETIHIVNRILKLIRCESSFFLSFSYPVFKYL